MKWPLYNCYLLMGRRIVLPVIFLFSTWSNKGCLMLFTKFQYLFLTQLLSLTLTVLHMLFFDNHTVMFLLLCTLIQILIIISVYISILTARFSTYIIHHHDFVSYCSNTVDYERNQYSSAVILLSLSWSSCL